MAEAQGEDVTMRLPVSPPVAPMLAKAVKEIPDGPYSYEPKWDGFRSIIFRDGDEVEIGSRNERPMTRYFPELVTEVVGQLPERCVIDGEIVIPDGEGARLDFEALLQRIHPAASRVNLLATRTPAHFVAFDLLALGDTDYTQRPFSERRARWKTLSRRSAPRCTSPRPPPTASWRGGGSPSSRAPGWMA
jgi:ATP-dependent DNA ligase